MLSFLLLLSHLAFAEPSYITFPSDIDWQTRQSDHFQIIFRKGSDAFATRALNSAEKAHKLLQPIFVETPEKTWIVLADFQDSTNGYALNFPYSHIVVFASPPEASGQLSNLDEWLDSILLHEYVHILHLYPAHGLWSLMRTVFGTWVVPNGMMPSHFHEGMATFLETEKTRGGRGRGTHFSMYRRKAVEQGVWGTSFFPLDLMDGTTSKFPHGVTAYFFGETLTREIWARKGAKGVYDLTQSYSSNWPYLLDGPLKEVFNIDYEDLWKEIFKKTTETAKKEIAEIKKSPLSDLHYLTQSRYRKVDPTLSPDGTKIAYRIDSPYRDNGGIQVIDSTSGKILNDFQFSMGSAESMCWGKAAGKEYILFLNNSESNHYSTNYVYALDSMTGDRSSFSNFEEKSPLSHVHRLACRADLKTLYAYKEVGGTGSLNELEADFSQRNKTLKVVRSWTLPEGAWVSSILANDIPLFALRQGSNTHIYQWKKGGDPQNLLTLNSYVYSLRKGASPQEIWAIATIDARDEVWSINLDLKKATKKVAVIGGINGFDTLNGKAFVSSYEHGGYDIASATLVSTPNTNVTTSAESKKPENAGFKFSESKSYSPWSTLVPKTWLPNMLFVPDGAQFLALVTWFDLSQKHIYDAFAGYDTRGAVFGAADYSYRFGANYINDWGIYYLPGYLRGDGVSRPNAFLKRWGANVGLSGTIGSFPPTVRIAALFKRLENSFLTPENQSIGAEIDLTYKIGFSRRPLSISPVNGIKLSGTHQQFFKGLGSTQNYFSSTLAAEAYVEAPWWRDSVWYLGNRLGYTEGSRFYNSYFEGGGEVLLAQSRGVFLNRGFLSASFLARRIYTTNLEYRFPILWVERGVSLWPGKLNVIHGAIVGDMTTWDYGPSAQPKDLFKRFYYSAGFELKSDWKFFFYLPTQLRLGIYHGFGPYGENVQVSCGVEASL